MRSLRLVLAIPIALLAAAIGARFALTFATHAPPNVTIDLAQPLAVVTNWGTTGSAQLGALLAALAFATAAYARALRPATPPAMGVNSPFAIAGITTVALLCAACYPVIFSSDVYAYAAYGELARLGGDPYAHRLLPGGNALLDAAVVQWGNPPPACVYGPVFVWIAGAVVWLAAPLQIAAQLDSLRLLSSIGLLLCTLLAYKAYPGNRAARLVASATVGLHPVAIWTAAEGHNDALAVAVALAGFALARRGFLGVGAAVAAFAGSIKLPGIAAAVPLALIEPRARVWAAASGLVMLAISAPLLASVFGNLAPHGRYAPQASLQAGVHALALLVVSEGPASIAAWAVAAAAAAACAAKAFALLRRPASEGWTYLALAGWLLVPNPYPWYAPWLLAVAAVAPGTRGATTLLWLSLGSALRYVPDAVGVPAPALSVALAAAANLPLLMLLPAFKPSAIINGSS